MKKFIKFLGIIFFIFFTLFILCLIYAFLVPIHLPTKQIIIYDINEKVIYQNNKTSNLNINEVNPFILKALVDIEDKRFYSHLGFDAFRMGKASYTNFKNKDIIEGGSTITQQYAKNIFLSNTQSLQRKVREFFYSLQIEMKYSKKEILEGYLNSIYYGHGIYGFKNASSFYFNKEVNELTISEITLLIGIPNGPSYYSPYLSMDNAIKKRNDLLYTLKEDNIINQEEYETSIKEAIVLDEKDYIKESEKNYYVDAVLEEVTAKKLSSDVLNVYTYYDENAQDALTSSINENTQQDNKLQTSGIVIEPYTSNILAIQGGNDYTSSNYNRALYAKRQIASTIKPLLYYSALSQGLDPSSTFSSEPTTFTLEDGTTYNPENYNKVYPYKDISMIHAISMSDNIYAVKTHLFLGMDTLVNALKAFNIEAQANPSLALGCVNLSVLDISKVYNTFASEGYYIEPSMIKEITNKEKSLYKRKIDPKQLLKRDETLVLNQMLTSTYDENNNDNAYATMAGSQSEVKTAVKSGTSDWDTWVIGFNPNYTVGIWNGFDDNTEVNKKQYATSKNIWRSCFNKLSENKPEVWYEMSDNIIPKRVNPITGVENSNGSVYWYLK